jgi:hypothetical protein
LAPSIHYRPGLVQVCVFRKKKQQNEWGGMGKTVDTDYYISMNKELAALDKAGRAIGAGGVPNAEEDDPVDSSSTAEPEATLYGPRRNRLSPRPRRRPDRSALPTRPS